MARRMAAAVLTVRSDPVAILPKLERTCIKARVNACRAAGMLWGRRHAEGNRPILCSAGDSVWCTSHLVLLTCCVAAADLQTPVLDRSFCREPQL